MRFRLATNSLIYLGLALLPIIIMEFDGLGTDFNGLGAFFYPVLLTITEKKKKVNFYEDTQDSEVSKSPAFGTRKIVLNHFLENDMKIVATDDGFIGLFERNIENVLKILNTIFATGITFGVGSEVVRRRDLCKFTLTGGGSHIQLDQIGGPSERNSLTFRRDSDSELTKWRTYKPRKVAPIEDIRKVLDKSHEYLIIRDSKENLYRDLLLGLDGYSLYYKEAFSGAYVYGWMIIEAVIDELWEEYVNTLSISRDDKDNLKQTNQWTAQHHIEMLYALKKIDLTNRNFLTKLRKKRNNIMHKMEPAAPDEVFGCLRLAMVMTLNRMRGNTDIFHDPRGNPLITKWNCNRKEK